MVLVMAYLNQVCAVGLNLKFKPFLHNMHVFKKAMTFFSFLFTYAI